MFRKLNLPLFAILAIMFVACTGTAGPGTAEPTERSNAIPTAGQASTAGPTSIPAAPTSSGQPPGTRVATPPSPTQTVVPPDASFTMDVDSGQAPLTVTFTNTSTGIFDAVELDYGDGQSGSSLAHDYTRAGEHTVTLIVTGPAGTDSATARITIEHGPLVRLSMSPDRASVGVGETREFRAAGFDALGNEVEITPEWSATGGSVDSDGRFTAGTVAGEFTVSVSAATPAGPMSSSVDVSVEPGPLASATITPAEVTLPPAGSRQLAYSIVDRFGNEIDDAVTVWTLDRELGSIAGDVLTAGTTAGFYPDGVKLDVVRQSEKIQASMDLTVLPGKLELIHIEPSNPVLKSEETVQFAATATDLFGNEIEGVEFLWKATGGSIDQAGTYVASRTPGRYEVSAVASDGTVVTGTTYVDRPLLAWEFKRGTFGWRAEQHVSNLRATPEGLDMFSTGGDPILVSPRFQVGQADIALRIRMRTLGSWFAEVWAGQGGQVTFEAVHDGEWHDYEIRLPQQIGDTDIRFDPMASSGKITIEHIYVVPDVSHLQSRIATPVFVQKFGQHGNDPGEFNNATRVATDDDGNIYTTSHESGLIQKFTPDGEFIMSFGGIGEEVGKFQKVRGIAVDDEGNIYVADFMNDRIQKFDALGEYLASWGNSGGGEGEFHGPHGIAIGPDGLVYVTDRFNDRVQVFGRDGSFIRQWGTTGIASGSFLQPTGISVDVQGFVYVSENRGSRVQKFTSGGEFVLGIGFPGRGLGRFFAAGDVAAGINGEVYVADAVNNRVQVFSAEGEFLGSWGTLGTRDGEFFEPFGITTGPDGRVIVADSRNTRIQIFEPPANIADLVSAP